MQKKSDIVYVQGKTPRNIGKMLSDMEVKAQCAENRRRQNYNDRCAWLCVRGDPANMLPFENVVCRLNKQMEGIRKIQFMVLQFMFWDTDKYADPPFTNLTSAYDQLLSKQDRLKNKAEYDLFIGTVSMKCIGFSTYFIPLLFHETRMYLNMQVAGVPKEVSEVSCTSRASIVGPLLHNCVCQICNKSFAEPRDFLNHFRDVDHLEFEEQFLAEGCSCVKMKMTTSWSIDDHIDKVKKDKKRKAVHELPERFERVEKGVITRSRLETRNQLDVPYTVDPFFPRVNSYHMVGHDTEPLLTADEYDALLEADNAKLPSLPDEQWIFKPPQTPCFY